METVTLTIPENASPDRLDKTIFYYYPQFSRRYIKSLIDRGSIFVNRKRIRRSSYQITPAATIKIFIKDNQEIENKGHQIHWFHLIIYKDEQLITVNKPAGIPTALQ